jgi:hypothetical protein
MPKPIPSYLLIYELNLLLILFINFKKFSLASYPGLKSFFFFTRCGGQNLSQLGDHRPHARDSRGYTRAQISQGILDETF